MAPSLFSNEYSRGPLYQYWKERNAEEKALRDQRVEESKLRSKGHQPLSPTFGPSSNDAYAHRATSGPPGYSSVGVSGSTDANGITAAAEVVGTVPDNLPSYVDATATATTTNRSGRHSASPAVHSSSAREEGGLLSAEEEKGRLAQLEEQRRQIDEDAAIAQTLSRETEDPEEVSEEQQQVGNGKQPVRKKSTGGKIGRWLADAASGYTKKQERW